MRRVRSERGLSGSGGDHADSLLLGRLTSAGGSSSWSGRGVTLEQLLGGVLQTSLGAAVDEGAGGAAEDHQKEAALGDDGGPDGVCQNSGVPVHHEHVQVPQSVGDEGRAHSDEVALQDGLLSPAALRHSGLNRNLLLLTHISVPFKAANMRLT